MQTKFQSKEKLIQKIWNKKSHYYEVADHTLEAFKKQYTYGLFTKLKLKPKSVLDFGCGNGSTIARLKETFPSIKSATGFDISALAIKEAKKKFPEFTFLVGDAERMTFPEKYDLVCSFYTFEHLDEPEKVLSQMVPLVKKNGYLYIICPNYGSPIYASPVFKGNFIQRVFSGILRDLTLLFNQHTTSLQWEAVEPIIDSGKKHIIDHDTTIEPYVFATRRYLEQHYPDFEIVHADSAWETAKMPDFSWKFTLATFPFQILNHFKIAPFCYWGPIHVLMARKKN